MMLLGQHSEADIDGRFFYRPFVWIVEHVSPWALWLGRRRDSGETGKCSIHHGTAAVAIELADSLDGEPEGPQICCHRIEAIARHRHLAPLIREIEGDARVTRREIGQSDQTIAPHVQGRLYHHVLSAHLRGFVMELLLRLGNRDLPHGPAKAAAAALEMMAAVEAI